MWFASGLLLLMAVLSIVLGCVEPRRLWWKVAAWQYKNPEANEPSDLKYTVNRVSCFAGAVVFLVLALVVLRVGNALT